MFFTILQNSIEFQVTSLPPNVYMLLRFQYFSPQVNPFNDNFLFVYSGTILTCLMLLTKRFALGLPSQARLFPSLLLKPWILAGNIPELVARVAFYS